MTIPPSLLHAGIVAIREVANVMLLGSLFFMLFVQLPAISEMQSPRARMAMRKTSFGRMFLWCWIGLTLLWATAISEFVIFDGRLPTHTGLAVAVGALFTLFFIIAQFGVYMQALFALEDGNSERAASLNRLLARMLGLEFLLALTVLLLHQLGPAVSGIDLLSMFAPPTA
jgi:uncharacterized membrane protein